MRIFRKTDYSRGVGVRKTAKNRKLSLPVSGMAPSFVNFRLIPFSSLLLAGIVTAFSLAIFSSPQTHAADLVSKMSPSEEAESYALYYAMGVCVKSDGDNLKDGAFVFTGQRINQANAKSGQWFKSVNPTAAYLQGVDGIQGTGDSGQVGCDQAALVNAALKLWGWSYDDGLCALGFKRASGLEARCTEKQGGSDEFTRGNTGKYEAAVKNQVYNGAAPTLSDSAKYVYYFNSFKNLCAKNATVTTTKPVGTTDRDFVINVASGTGDSAKVTPTYYLSTNKSKNDSVNVINNNYFEPNSYTTLTCAQLASRINDSTAAYVAYLKTDAAESDDSAANGSSDAVTTCGIEGVGWIICPVVRFLGSLSDGLYGFISDTFLQTNPSIVASGGPTYTAWQGLLGLANIIFVIIFLFIIFSQATGYGISNYGVKKLLPKIIIGAILINISYFLCQALVDISNIAGYSIKSLLDAQKGTTVTNADPWSELTTQVLSVGLTGAAAGGAVIVGVAALNTGLLLGGVIAVVLTLVFIALFLLARQVLIVLCVVIAPIAFALWLLPNTEKFFKMWWKIFFAMLIVFPLASLVVGACDLASTVISKSANDAISSGQ